MLLSLPMIGSVSSTYSSSCIDATDWPAIELEPRICFSNIVDFCTLNKFSSSLLLSKIYCSLKANRETFVTNELILDGT